MKASWIVVLVVGGALGQGLPKATAEYGAFALPDQDGARLIAVAGVPDAARVRTALCSDGSDVPVQFERRQPGRKDDDGRQLPSRFDRLQGDVFRVVRGKVGETASCFLVGNGWMSGATVLPMKASVSGGACGRGVEERLAASRGRDVVRCFSLGRLDGERQAVLAEFARVGTDALASVVLMDGERVLSGDYPAKFRGAGEDLWRVDDGGALSGEGFHVAFVVQRGNRYAMGVSWSGAEGRSLAVFVSESGKGFTRVIEDYWYQAPE